LLADCDLNVLETFVPEQEWDLGPGDMLYLPPGIAHHGVALEACMTWSIGMRAPSQADLLQALGEWLAEAHAEGTRYRDMSLPSTLRAGEIAPAALGTLREMMAEPLRPGTAIDGFLARFLSRYRLAHLPAPAAEMVDERSLAAALANNCSVQKNPWTRFTWIEQGGTARLFAAGEEFSCSPAIAAQLCACPLEITVKNPLSPDQLPLLCQLINAGHLFLHDPVT
jgi:50S ribosomal protein L16 3-hydroxylase